MEINNTGKRYKGGNAATLSQPHKKADSLGYC